MNCRSFLSPIPPFSLSLSTVSLSILASLFLAGCGGASKGGHGGKTPNTSDLYSLEVESQNEAKFDLTYLGKPVLWSVRAAQGGVDLVEIKKGSFDEVAKELKAVKVRAGDYVTLEITLTGEKKGKSTVLATNLQSEADRDKKTAAIWQTSCLTINPGFAILEGINTKVIGEEPVVVVDLDLCDFAKVLVTPTISITPEQYKRDFREVSYKCDLTNDSRFTGPEQQSVVYAYPPEVSCSIGYDKPDATVLVQNNGVKDRKIEKPVGAQEVFTGMMFDGMDKGPRGDEVHRFVLTQDSSTSFPLPFGSSKDCHTLEFQFFYSADESATTVAEQKEMRVVWERKFNTATSKLEWSPLPQTNLPYAVEVQKINSNHIRFYLHCTWENTTGLDIVEG